MVAAIFACPSPGKGWSPKSSSQATTPSEKTSLGGPTRLPRICSGEA